MYTHPVQLKHFNNFHYSSVENNLKLTEIGKNDKISVFWLQKATIKQFFHFFVTGK